MELKEVYGGYRVSACGVVLGKRGKPLSPSDNGKGYLIVTLWEGGRRLTKSVHRLVAEAWIPNPDELSDVNHRDCNKHNNAKDNLEWMTHGDNIKHSFDNECRSAVGEDNAHSLITEAQAREICALLSEGLKSAAIRDGGYPYNIVRKIKGRKIWTHVSQDYIW